MDTTHCIYSMPCECSRRYIGETSRLLGVRTENRNIILDKGYWEKSKLAHHTCDEGASSKFYTLSQTVYGENSTWNQPILASPSWKFLRYGPHLISKDISKYQGIPDLPVIPALRPFGGSTAVVIQDKHKRTLHFQNDLENRCGFFRTSHRTSW